jgi:hypothetical protein
MEIDMNEKCVWCGERFGYHVKLSNLCPVGIQTFTSETMWRKLQNKSFESVLLEFSAFLHTLPELQNGHDVGMVEVGYTDEGRLNYGPIWLSRNETDAIVKQFLAQRTAIASNNLINISKPE